MNYFINLFNFVVNFNRLVIKSDHFFSNSFTKNKNFRLKYQLLNLNRRP